MRLAALVCAGCGAHAAAPTLGNEGGEVAPTLHGVTAVRAIERADLPRYTLATICGLRGGELACLPTFVSECELQAPAGDCGDQAHAWSYRVGDDGTVTIDTQPPRALF